MGDLTPKPESYLLVLALSDLSPFASLSPYFIIIFLILASAQPGFST